MGKRVMTAALLSGLAACGGGGGQTTIDVVTGAASPEGSVESFLSAAREAQVAKATGEFTQADRAYERMASVFGTRDGSILGTYPAREVHDRMVVLAACLRPTTYRIVSQPDPAAWENKQTVVTVELVRDSEPLTLPFRVVLGRGDRWFVEQIQLNLSSFTC